MDLIGPLCGSRENRGSFTGDRAENRSNDKIKAWPKWRSRPLQYHCRMARSGRGSMRCAVTTRKKSDLLNSGARRLIFAR